MYEDRLSKPEKKPYSREYSFRQVGRGTRKTAAFSQGQSANRRQLVRVQGDQTSVNKREFKVKIRSRKMGLETPRARGGVFLGRIWELK